MAFFKKKRKRQNSARPDHTAKYAEHACKKKVNLMGNHTLRNLQQLCGVLVWRLHRLDSLEHCLQPARTGYTMYCVCVCVYGCAHVCFLCGGSSAVPCAPSRRLCVRGCVPAPALCLPMCAVRRKWLCLFKLSTLSHVGQFSGNENPAPCPLPSRSAPGPCAVLLPPLYPPPAKSF